MKLLAVGDIADYQTTRMAVLTACETRWINILASFERYCDTITAGHQDAKEGIGLVHADFAFRKCKRRCVDEAGSQGRAEKRVLF
jgi:hypothetical protein